ncbi:MAG TPA: hypothetical protein DIW17_07240 [Clostridiales bacterium]|nr:hypothetical protein [Clostridia bacterium]MDD4679906.1 hypothetical protein [Clostridia bacterium]HCS73651.1 hypothetical protein [Clostridiales bacterium]
MKTILKLITFLASRIIGIAVVLILIIMAIFISYDMANIYVMANDGLSKRAEIIIHNENPSSLSKFFTLQYLNSDSMLLSDQFKDYTVHDYDYELKIKHMWVWPWESTTEVTVEEYIPESSWRFDISDKMRERLTLAQMPPEDETGEEDEEDEVENGENVEGSTDEGTDTPAEEEFKLEIPKPKWQNGEKIIEFRKVDGRWEISGMVFIKSINPEQNNKEEQ